MKEISAVFSACGPQHVDLFLNKVAPSVVRFIKSREYVVSVPDELVGEFKARLPKEYQVRSDADFLNKHKNTLDKYLNNDTNRRGWYLQQLLKINFLNMSAPEDLIVIWDADTIPLKPIDFISNRAKLIFYKSSEFHEPYFENIKELLGLNREVQHSWIAQCFPFYGGWTHELVQLIETKKQMSYLEAILKSLNQSINSSFSEYELMGTFLNKYHPESFEITQNRWSRHGSLTYDPEKLSQRKLKALSRKYDFITFEIWQKKRPYYEILKQRIIKRLTYFKKF